MSHRLPLVATTAATALFTLALTAFAAQPPRYRPLTPTQLDQLTRPIALYPDVLLAKILPASTIPLDVAIASQWLAANPTPSDDQIAAQPWDSSIQFLAHYPAVFHLLADDLAWTRQLGLAYANQPDDVRKSIQRLRAKARAVGTLTNTPEQTVIIENHYIQIQPAVPEIIYVPIYDPAICYTHRSPPHFERPTPPANPTPTNPTPVDTPPAEPRVGAIRSHPTPAPQQTSSEDGTQHVTTPDPSPTPSTTPPTPAAQAPQPTPNQPAPAPTPTAAPTQGALTAPQEPVRIEPPAPVNRDDHRPSIR